MRIQPSENNGKRPREFKMNGGISLGNIIVILTLIVTVSISYSNLSASVQNIEKKADKSVVDLQFSYIRQQLDEIKELIKGG